MLTRRPLLRIPGCLAVATLAMAGSSCSPAPAAPDVIDAVDRLDALVTDLADTPAMIDAGDIATDDPSADAVLDAPCDIFPGGPGFECIPDFRADVAASCPPVRTCSSVPCPTGCVSCYANPFAPAGYVCLPDPHADVTVTCPRRVCDLADCPTGCNACNEPEFCSPTIGPDGAMVASCDPQLVCNPADCPPGCDALI